METDEKTGAQNPARTKSRLTPNQIRSFWAAWGGWSMDGMDSFIYSLVLVPALTELLPRSGIPATTANIGFYGGLFFALFMIGYGMAMVWGPIADRFGRVRTMMFSILCFSLFTLLAAFSTGIWSLAIFRFMAGIGIGGEWALGAALVSEDWPEERRTMGAALMHTGYYIGILFAAIANALIGSHYGWRVMFALGGVPALLIGLIRNNVHEPERWKDRQQELGDKWKAHSAFLKLFSKQYCKRTIINSLYLIVSLCGLWAGSVYSPTAMTYIAERMGKTVSESARLASYSTGLLGIATVLGALIVPFLADWLGRRATLGLFYVVMMLSIWLAFGHVFYMQHNPIAWFLVCSVLLGLGGANFIVYSFWLPEQYGTDCRASAFAFITNVGRFAAAGFTFLVGAGVRHFQTFGIPLAMTALAFVVGLALVPFGEETKGKHLPA
ncbi:MAG TPA: MFS transporter [Candidatus Dormibacteraeota bacterium]|nr:MFS transporter [Candidatus Dormibacteraeota bacterium]